jgi:DNA mismatch repair protein MutL
LGKFICWFETRNSFQSAATDFTFETEEVTGSLFNDEDVEQCKMYQIHKKIYRIPIKSGMVIVDQQGTSTRYEQFFGNMTVQQASSQQLLFPLDLFFRQVN